MTLLLNLKLAAPPVRAGAVGCGYKDETMKRVKNIVLLVSTIWLSVLVGGCNVYDHYSAAEDPDDQDFVTLVLNVGLVSPTRAAADNDRELMHSLRIILLDAEEGGMVEYNTRLGFNTGAESLDYHFIRTKPGKKKIFLIANEEGIASVGGVTGYSNLTALLDDLEAQGEDGKAGMSSTEAESRLKEVWFTPGDYSGANGWIPLSSSYAFEINESELTADNRRVEKTFYLVHAATKFEFEFINNRLSPMRIDALSISSIADNMYLMAKFRDTAAEDKKVTWGKGGSTQTAYWIDWLKKVSDATNKDSKDPNNEWTNADYGWIKDYVVPDPPIHAEKKLIESGVLISSNQAITIPANGGKEILPVVYFPESKNGGDNQAYYFSIRLKDAINGTEGYFENVHLTNADQSHANLVTLFRNTHVKITCILGYNEQDIQLTLQIGICPWNEGTINIPPFD